MLYLHMKSILATTSIKLCKEEISDATVAAEQETEDFERKGLSLMCTCVLPNGLAASTMQEHRPSLIDTSPGPRFACVGDVLALT